MLTICEEMKEIHKVIMYMKNHILKKLISLFEYVTRKKVSDNQKIADIIERKKSLYPVSKISHHALHCHSFSKE